MITFLQDIHYDDDSGPYLYSDDCYLYSDQASRQEF